MKNILTFVLFSLIFINNLFGQSYSEQGLEKSDSLKNLEYPYILPIYGGLHTNLDTNFLTLPV